MTSLEKMLKRLEFEHKNDVRELKGEPLLAIPVELMTEDEYKDFLKSQTVVVKPEPKKVEAKKEVEPVQKVEYTKSSTNTVKNEQKVISRVIVNKPTEEVKKEDKSVQSKKVKEETKPAEIIKISEPKVVVVETSKEEKEENSMKEAVDILKKGLEKIGLSPDEQTTETTKEETVEENNKVIEKEITQVKKKLLNISKDVLSNKVVKPRIEDYNKLSSSKKKIAISNMLKEIVTEVAEPAQIQDVLNFSCNINTIAGNNNKREYSTMLKSLKETISKLKDNPLIQKIINKIDSEINNFILVNKVKFISYIKNMESDLEINEDNLTAVSSAIDSITSRINNGEDFSKIVNSLKDSIFLQKQPDEAKVVDCVENAEEENIETKNEEIVEEKPVFLTPEEIDVLEDTMHEVLMGNQ